MKSHVIKLIEVSWLILLQLQFRTWKVPRDTQPLFQNKLISVDYTLFCCSGLPMQFLDINIQSPEKHQSYTKISGKYHKITLNP